jgi:23S rRNA pseudouridine1911/1915/1917 synthase
MPRLSFTADASARRLDLLVAERLKERGVTRSLLQRLAAEGKVLLDGKAARPASAVRSGQRVEVELPEERPFEIVPREGSLSILFEDEACLAVDKPAGLVVHPARGHWDDTLVNLLRGRGVNLSTGVGPGRPGIVHRLDKETSGVLLVAKTDAAQARIVDQFRARTVEKVYLALVWGTLPEEVREVRLPVGRDPHRRTRWAVCPGGREAVTLLATVERLSHVSLVEARPRTGRTHQIRVHLAHLRHPIVGDALYGGHPENGLPSLRLRRAVQEAGRFFLHAHSLTFESPASGPVTVISPLPPDFLEVLEVFRSHG